MIFSRKKVFFVYSPNYRFGGGTVMRGEQLSSIVKKRIDKKYKVSFKPSTCDFRNSILFMTKMAVFTTSVDRLEELLNKGNKLLFDANDGKIDNEKVQLATAIIVSSSVGLEEYRKRYPNKNIFLIDHHVDPRIKPMKHTDTGNFRIGYFGEPTNTIITERIENIVDIIPIDTSSQKNIKWLDTMPYYNVHYAVRNKREFDDFKPATKVFTAAYCNSNIIIQDTEEEALRWLGNDYPYLIKGDPTEGNILDMLQKIRTDYKQDNQNWRYGLSVTKRINKQLTNDHISKQFFRMLKKLDLDI